MRTLTYSSYFKKITHNSYIDAYAEYAVVPDQRINTKSYMQSRTNCFPFIAIIHFRLFCCCLCSCSASSARFQSCRRFVSRIISMKTSKSQVAYMI